MPLATPGSENTLYPKRLDDRMQHKVLDCHDRFVKRNLVGVRLLGWDLPGAVDNGKKGRVQYRSSEPSLFEAIIRAKRFQARSTPRLTIGKPGFDGRTHVNFTHQIILGRAVSSCANPLDKIIPQE